MPKLRRPQSKKAQHLDVLIKQIETEEASDANSSDVNFFTSITTTISVGNSGSLSTSGAIYAKEIYTVMEIGNQAVTFHIDCGASINIITEALIEN